MEMCELPNNAIKKSTAADSVFSNDFCLKNPIVQCSHVGNGSRLCDHTLSCLCHNVVLESLMGFGASSKEDTPGKI